MESLHKLGETVKAHPVLFTCIGAAIAIYFLWPAGTSGSNQSAITAQESAAIAAASQANAAITGANLASQTQIALSHDQLSSVGIQAATAQAINGQNTAAASYVAGLQADVATQTLQTQLAGYQLSSTTAISLGQQALTSQASAQEFISSLEHAGLNTPGFATAGGNYGATDTQSTAVAGNVATHANDLAANVAGWAINGGGAFLASPWQPAPGVFPGQG